VIKTVTVGVAPEEMDKARSEAEQMKRTLEEKQRAKEEELRQVKELLDSKKSEIASEVAATEEEIAKKRSDRLQLRTRLHEMENAIMHSTAQIDEAKRHEVAIRQKQMEIDRQRQEAEQAAEQTRAIEDEASFLATKYSDLGQELANKTSKLDRLTGKYAEIKQEAEDIQAENQREREQLLETIRELTRHIQLKDFILDNFVPREETEKVENRAYWDEEQDAWLLHPTDYRHLNLAIRRPGSAKAQLRRPTSDFALAHAMQGAQQHAGAGGDGGPRFRAENILELALDMPERTTQDYGEAAASQQGMDVGGGGGGVGSANHELQMHLQQQAAAQAAAANANRGMQAYMQMGGADPMMQQQYRR
jgi:kinesin family protein 3/17